MTQPSGVNASGSERRRLEAEMLMYQADRSKLLRQRTAIEMEKRVLKKELEEMSLALLRKTDEEQKMINDIQNTENELFRLRKRFNLLT